MATVPHGHVRSASNINPGFGVRPRSQVNVQLKIETRQLEIDHVSSVHKVLQSSIQFNEFDCTQVM
jgi:hypothetical protein